MAEAANFSVLAISVAVIAVAVATDSPQYEHTDQIGCISKQIYKYVNATAFQENLDSVFASLPSNLSDGYATSSEDKAGKTDPVYGIAVCRKYLSTAECSKCVMEAAKQLNATCFQSSGGRIHLDGCFLHYQNTSRFYNWYVDPGSARYCDSTIDNDPQTFSQRAQDLSSQLISNASANNSYAVGSIDGSLYGLAQCWPSLTANSCQTCLGEAQKKLLECIPQHGGRGLEGGCFMRYSTYSFFSDNQTISSTNTTLSSGKSSSKIAYALLGSIGGTALIAVLLCLVLFCRHTGHRNGYARTDENVTARGNFEHVSFEYEVLRDSTRNFDRNNMLGQGGFGEVYKGILPDGTVVAVKKLNGSHDTIQGAEEFLTEVKLLTSARHRNLVRLLGCCAQGNERLLVYEFMSNNALHRHLFGTIKTALTWEIRLDIIVGTARGLAYLHEDSNVRIIHRDIKCANILLDDRFNPKIADFGIARLFPEGETHVSTKVAGTIGYTAPEYALNGQLTEKADVYSYGIVVLEIVCGRKCVDATLPAPMHILLEWAWNKYDHANVLDIVDPKLEGQYPRDQALRVITIALLCTHASSGVRPSMSQVASMLTNDLEIRFQPTKPVFIDAAAARPQSSAATTNSATSTSAAASHQSPRPESSAATTNSATSTSAAASHQSPRPESSAATTNSATSTSAAASHQSPGSMTVSLFPR